VGSRFEIRLLGRIDLVEHDVRGPDGQCPSLGHRVARVPRQAGEHLFDLTAVDENRRQLGPELADDIDLLADHPADELERLVDDGVEVRDLRPQDLPATESKQLAGQLCCSVGGVVDPNDILTERLVGNPAEQE
jgi:hypothetical protein